MKCPKCKHEIKDSWNFCPECGAVLYGERGDIPFPDLVIMCYGRTTSLVIGGKQWFFGREVHFSHSVDKNNGNPRIRFDADAVEPMLPPTVSEFWRAELNRALSEQEYPE